MRLIMTFVVITAGLYGLVFFTPGSNSPKLGIDLQGGTRVTLSARTADGSDPSRTAMSLARDIMERRVNGSGVAGAQVQIDGSRQIVITVPGQDNLDNLTRSAQLNIRPVMGAWNNPAIQPPVTGTPGATGTTTPAAEATGTGVTGTEAAGTASSGAATTNPPASSGSSTPTTAGSGDVVGPEGSQTTAEGTSAAPSTSAGQGLRANAARAVAATGETTPGTATDGTAVTSTGAPSTGVPSTTAAVSTESVTGAAATTGTETGGAAATSTSKAPIAAFPTGSDATVPTQPAGTDQAAWKAWESAVQAAYTAGIGPTCAQIATYQGLDKQDKPLLACDQPATEGQPSTVVYLLDTTLVPGTEISDATSGLDTQSGNGWVINVTFKSDGFSTWSSYTVGHVGTQTAFTLDGEVLSAPTIQTAINTRTTMVSGSFNQTTAKALADSLKFGALPLAFSRQESEQVSAELGSQYLEAGLIAGGIGLLLVIIYCLMYYRLLGVITIGSLVLSGGLVYAVMVLLGRWINLSLDLAGIAGLIIAIGITADSFVVYFERIKDEVREGRTFRSAVPRGWKRAKRTILSADAVSFLSAAILYFLAVGDVKGFAFTLGLSTVLDLVVVFLVTHPLVSLAAGSKIFTSPSMSGLGAVAKAGSEQRATSARLTAKEA